MTVQHNQRLFRRAIRWRPQRYWLNSWDVPRRSGSAPSTASSWTTALRFLVSEQEFDVIFGGIQQRGLAYCADPDHQHPGKINHCDGGRSVYWNDPDGHSPEILTWPYGSGAG